MITSFIMHYKKEPGKGPQLPKTLLSNPAPP